MIEGIGNLPSLRRLTWLTPRPVSGSLNLGDKVPYDKAGIGFVRQYTVAALVATATKGGNWGRQWWHAQLTIDFGALEREVLFPEEPLEFVEVGQPSARKRDKAKGREFARQDIG